MTTMLFFLASHGVQRLEESRLWTASIQRLPSLFWRLVQAHEHTCALTHTHIHTHTQTDKSLASLILHAKGKWPVSQRIYWTSVSAKEKECGYTILPKPSLSVVFNSLWPLPTWGTHHYCPSRHCLLPRLLYLIRSHGHVTRR